MGEPTAVIAKVDGTASRYLSGRFKIQGFPTLHMFSQGKMYQYKGYAPNERCPAADAALQAQLAGVRDTQR
jgi:protein-disulfide isomerase-like protein with CxxC motif